MSYRNEMSNIEDKELGYKHHTQEFIDVSDELRRVGQMGMVAKQEIGSVSKFFDAIEYLYEIYSSYLKDPEEIKKRLDEIEEYILSPKYNFKLQEYFNGDSESVYGDIKIYELKVIKRLKKIFTEISDNLVWSELRPKPSIKNKDEFPEIENKVLKEVMRGFKDAIK